MVRSPKVVGCLVLLVAAVGPAAAQESKAAAATHKKLQQKVTVSAKEVGLKDFLEDVKREMDNPVRFKIDNGSGVSNNMKVSYSGKDVTVEKLLNDLSDKYEFGYVVISNAANNKEDGAVLLRKGKGKERGYEAGKEPKKGVQLPPLLPRPLEVPVFEQARPAEVAVGAFTARP